MISLENLSFSYPSSAKPVFRDLSLRIETGSWTAITGPDGSGKTTLGKLITGILEPVAGSVRINPSDPAHPRAVGYLGGDPYDALVGVSVEEDIVFGLQNLGLPGTEMERRLKRTIQWTGLTGMEQRLTHTLSGGEQQKLALAGLLAMGARAIILDEALTMLDRPSRQSIRSLLSRLRGELGLTVLETTQDLEEIWPLDRVVLLGADGIDFSGPPAELMLSRRGMDWISRTWGMTRLRSALYEKGLITAAQMAQPDLFPTLLQKIF